MRNTFNSEKSSGELNSAETDAPRKILLHRIKRSDCIMIGQRFNTKSKRRLLIGQLLGRPRSSKVVQGRPRSSKVAQGRPRSSGFLGAIFFLGISPTFFELPVPMATLVSLKLSCHICYRPFIGATELKSHLALLFRLKITTTTGKTI
ncbi:uncharacterized protein BX664DRAFT_313766 [Halteromyces radiatus]|uniref:uncharacterized protein n=1 Tax=Halteromyces radiatus TaxID=101107 RepID=UPI00221F7222|nr:uncharacterized protein BX664DRAFT_313766 [Halteromyces radiatus]KAI8093747.1 hypothetical protein BX664DRAFT_313766 [Halteromyces radiatus]